jgi:hypothetical protein
MVSKPEARLGKLRRNQFDVFSNPADSLFDGYERRRRDGEWE